MVINERHLIIGTKKAPLSGESIQAIFPEINRLQQISRRPVFFEVNETLARITRRGKIHYVSGENKKSIKEIREEYNELKKEKRRKLTSADFSHVYHLPNPETIKKIKNLGAINATPTEFRDMTPDQIAAEGSRKFRETGTRMVIDAGKATRTEKATLKAASTIVPVS